jgi:hypothetical protein
MGIWGCYDVGMWGYGGVGIYCACDILKDHRKAKTHTQVSIRKLVTHGIDN